MITSLLTSFFHLRRTTTHVTAIVGLTGLAAFSSAHASVPSVQPNTVVTGDTFSVEVVGFNTADPGANEYIILPGLTPTFGATTSYANDALGGQTLTITSTEAVIAGITTDTISLSVPTNFVPAGTKDNDGNILNAIQFSFGSYLGGSNPLNLSTAATGFTATASVIFKVAGVTTSAAAPATVTSTSGGTAISSFGQTTSTPSTTDISGNQVTGLSLTVTYAAVPEPSTNAAILLGAAGLVGTIVVRNRRRVRA